MKTFKTLILSSTVLALGACSMVDSFNEVEALNAATPVGSPFTQALSQEYRTYSNDQLENHFDYPDALHFARKGLAAAAGEPILPEPVSDWNVDEIYAQELAAARGRLITAYDLGAREAAPALSAAAQAKFDCWIEFQEESWRDSDTIDCKHEFASLMQQIESGLTAPAPTIIEPIVAAPPAPAFDSEVFNINPAEPMAPENAMYLIFFNWDSSKVDTGAMNILEAVAGEVTQNTPNTISVIGHADTSGPTAYNQRLALKRAKAAKDKLTGLGVSADLIMVDAKGETDLLVPTPDNVREPANRRVNISFE